MRSAQRVTAYMYIQTLCSCRQVADHGMCRLARPREVCRVVFSRSADAAGRESRARPDAAAARAPRGARAPRRRPRVRETMSKLDFRSWSLHFFFSIMRLC